MHSLKVQHTSLVLMNLCKETGLSLLCDVESVISAVFGLCSWLQPELELSFEKDFVQPVRQIAASVRTCLQNLRNAVDHAWLNPVTTGFFMNFVLTVGLLSI